MLPSTTNGSLALVKVSILLTTTNSAHYGLPLPQRGRGGRVGGEGYNSAWRSISRAVWVERSRTSAREPVKRFFGAVTPFASASAM